MLRDLRGGARRPLRALTDAGASSPSRRTSLHSQSMHAIVALTVVISTILSASG